MLIVLWNPSLMKKLLKSEICESHKQCMEPTDVHYPPLILLGEQCTNKKVKNHGSKKKKKKGNTNAKRATFQLSKPHPSLIILA